MGLFSTKEEKEEKKVTKKLEKIEKFKSRYNLENVDENDVDTLVNIYLELMGTDSIKLGTGLTGNAEDSAKLSYLNALVEQNWMIMNQLSRLNKNLEKLIEK